MSRAQDRSCAASTEVEGNRWVGVTSMRPLVAPTRVLRREPVSPEKPRRWSQSVRSGGSKAAEEVKMVTLMLVVGPW
jgi:hypothetical protein